jgi:CubicO group peptidase (beta-lactamase class C family)
MASYLKEFKVNSKGWAQPTVRHVLSHTAGLPMLNPFERFKAVHLADEPAPTNGDLVKAWTSPGEALRHEPGTKFEYSNVGYLWLGMLVERVSGVRYETLVTERILKPLGMTRTGFVHADINKAARGYAHAYSLGGVLGALLGDERLYAGKAWGYRGIRNYYVNGPAYAGLVGPVSDMEHFVRMQLQDGTFDGKRILSPESCAAMREPTKDPQGKPLQIGIGWWVEDNDGERVCYHEGMGGGFRTQLRIYPERHYGVIVASNDHEYDTFNITRCVVSPEAASQP